MSSQSLSPEKRETALPSYSRLRMMWRVLLFLIWSFVLASLHLIVRAVRPDLKLWLPMIWHRGCCRIFGIVVQVSGTATTERPVLFVSNHVSYLDIVVLGGVLAGSFISKADVASWPVFGFLARLQDTLFIERASRHVKGQLDQMQQRLQHADNLILFPEGTSSDGTQVLPFKSALFKSVEKGAPVSVWIQPVSLSYHSYCGQEMPQSIRDCYAWYADMPALSHMARMAGMKQVSVLVTLHPIVSGETFANRKPLAEYCQQQVAEGVEKGLIVNVA